MRARRGWAGIAVGALVLVAGCGGDPRMDEVLQQLRALQRERADATTLRGEMRDAFAPLREALSKLALDQAEVRTRFADVSSEVGEVLGAVKGSVDAAARARLEQLQQRLSQLESEMRQRAEAAQQEQDAILRALDLTAEKLDGFLQRVQAVGQPGREKRTEPETPPAKAGTEGEGGQERAGERAPPGLDWWWGVGGLLLALGIAAGVGRRRTVAPPPVNATVAPPVDVPRSEPNGAVVGHLRAVGAAEAPQPLAHTLELEHPQPEAAVDVARRWLGEDPRVLALPEPEVHGSAGRISVRYGLAPDLPPGEAARVEAEVAGAVRSVGPLTP